MSEEIYFVDWEGPLPSGLSVRLRRMHGCELSALAREGLPLFVLGCRAIAELSPQRVVNDLCNQTERVILCPRNQPELLVDWVRAGFHRVIRPERLTLVLGREGSTSFRPVVEPATWLPTLTYDTRDCPIIAALRHVQHRDISSWAARIGVHRRTLYRRCVRTYGATPSELWARYILALDRKRRRLGIGCAQFATELGYTDASTMLRALREALRHIPSRDTS